MNQAGRSNNTAPRAIGPALSGALASVVGSALNLSRRLVGLDVVRETAGKTILVPITDDNFAPALCCGEFAIVDTRNTTLEDGAIIYRRDDFSFCSIDPHRTRTQSLSIVQLRTPTPEMEQCLDQSDSGHPPPFWQILLGWSRAWGDLSALEKRGIPVRDGRIPMSDGFISEKNLRPMVVGRVIGVLGHEGRSLNWRDEQ